MNALLRISTSFFLVLFFAGSSLAAQDWKMDTPHTSINFTVRHFVTPVLGQFKDYTGKITFDKKDLKNSNIDITVKVDSLDTGVVDRDNHLRSPDFFETQTHKTLRFVADDIRSLENNLYEAHGKMTIKNVTRDLVLSFEAMEEQDHPFPNMKCTIVSGLVGKTSLKRLDYGVGTGAFFQTGVVGNDVEISFYTELHRPKPGCR